MLMRVARKGTLELVSVELLRLRALLIGWPSARWKAGVRLAAVFAALLLLGGVAALPAQVPDTASPQASSKVAEGTFLSVQNAGVHAEGADLVLQRVKADQPLQISFADCEGLGVQREAEQWWLLPTNLAEAPIHANSELWILPRNPMSTDASWHLRLKGAEATVTRAGTGLDVVIPTASVTLSKAEARPHSDPFGHRFSFRIDGGRDLEDALAAFYWGTLLPSVAEKTFAANFPYSSGYVLSTLDVHAYAGSYPAVDHEFQIKGRLAMGTEADLDLVKRMIELQFKLMDDDPEQLHRSPTSVQPNGTREYHIRRDSKDSHQNAAMFPVTANIEVVEESWHYFEARKDIAWLRRNIAHLEQAAGWTLQNTDPYDRVWSDVYYEDQVIKDGRETEAQAFAAYTFGLLARMEALLGQQAKADVYAGHAKKMAAVLIASLPMGYWDDKGHRFVDWVDRNAKVHDHTPLLANTLPLTFGYAMEAQAAAVRQLVTANDKEFERFPSFVAANIAAYDSSEMGTAGAYDLSAAGRYWYWDAAFRQSQNQNERLFRQLMAVAAEGKKADYLMGERYDMDHVYYVDGKDAHGAEKYYEYPNVFAAVLIAKYLGVTVPAEADLLVAPHLKGGGEVELATPRYAVHYALGENGFSLKNLSDHARRMEVDLSAVGSGSGHYRRQGSPRNSPVGTRFTVTLLPQQEARWTAVP